MTVSFTGGLVKCNNCYIKPENITMIRPDTKYSNKPVTRICTNGIESTSVGQVVTQDVYTNIDIDKVAGAVVEAEKTGNIIDING